mmetsp:Transcript_47950/g.137708  ORF Transcript_47950/g.137708 Transcript_47950/m.137708 type:complete len:235 (+) Transcript_47950:240-944(+)
MRVWKSTPTSSPPSVCASSRSAKMSVTGAPSALPVNNSRSGWCNLGPRRPRRLSSFKSPGSTELRPCTAAGADAVPAAAPAMATSAAMATPASMASRSSCATSRVSSTSARILGKPSALAAATASSSWKTKAPRTSLSASDNERQPRAPQNSTQALQSCESSTSAMPSVTSQVGSFRAMSIALCTRSSSWVSASASGARAAPRKLANAVQSTSSAWSPLPTMSQHTMCRYRKPS